MKNSFNYISGKPWIDSRNHPKGACVIITSTTLTLAAFGIVPATPITRQNMPNVIKIEHNSENDDAVSPRDITIEDDLRALRKAMEEPGDSKDFESLCHELGL
ncbi:MAG: hypothetical protein ABSG67_00475 [Thermoguttaceae bacterium]